MTYQIPEEQLAAASNPLPQGTPRYQPADVDHGLLDYAKDFGRGVLRGGVGFGESLVELGDSTAELFGGDLFEGNDLTWKEDLLGENETWVGTLSEGITQFAIGFIPVAGVTSKIGKAAQFGKAGQYITTALGAGAVADFVAFNGHEGRLSDLIEQYPSLQNPISGWLASKEDDSEWEGRFKNALEGLALGPIADVALGGVKLLVGAKKAQAKGGDKAGEDYIKKHAPALLGAIEDPLTFKEARGQLLGLGMPKKEVDASMAIIQETAKSLGLKPDEYVGITMKRIERGVVKDPDALQQMAVEAFEGEVPVSVGPKENIFDFAKNLNDHLISTYGTRDIKPGTAQWEEAKGWAADEVRKQLQSGRDGTEWYQKSIDNQFHYLSYKHPELAENGPDRVLFSTFLSLTSPGRMPDANMKTAEAWYRIYKETGSIPEKNPYTGNNWDTVGPTGRVEAGNEFLRVFNSFGNPEDAQKFLFTPLPYETMLKEWAFRSGKDVAKLHGKRGSEIAHYLEGLEKITDGSNVSRKNVRHSDEVPPILMIGPKVGPFNLNQAGFHQYLTADKWYSRSFRRYFGKLFDERPNAQIAKDASVRLSRLISAGKIGKEDLSATLSALGVKRGNKLTKAAEKELKKQYEEYLENGASGNDSLDKVFNKVKATFTDIETPSSNLERGYMARFAAEVSEELGMTVSAFQANLWYFEQTLWAKAGTGRGVTGDFEDAARSLIEAGGYRPDVPGTASSEGVRNDAGGNPQVSRGDGSGTQQGGSAAADGGAGTGRGRGSDQRGSTHPGSESGSVTKAADRLATRAARVNRIGDEALEYAQQSGIEPLPLTRYADVDQERAERIAEAYENMKHAPEDPEVKAAYDALARETIAQYEFLKSKGYKFEWTTEPSTYADHKILLDELDKGKPMRVFLSEGGFGEDAGKYPGHPLLAPSGIVEDGKELLVNDLFRAVHDYFGHGKPGSSFGARGEENAWRAHSVMFSPEARKALTTETRGQNSWVNYGPKAQDNQAAIKAGRVSEDFTFADQKAGLLPDEFRQLDEEVNPDLLKQADGEVTQGEIKFEEDGRAVIRIFKEGNVSTVVHEFAHLYRRNLERLSPGTLSEANKVFGVVDGNWTRADDEKFARAFEQYLADGKAPTEGMKSLFSKFKEWMGKIYDGAAKSALGDDISPEMRDFFDRMLGKPTREQRVVKTTAKIRSKIAARISDELAKQPVDRGDFSDPAALMMDAVDGIDFNLDKVLTDMESKDVFNIFSEELEKQFKKLNGGVESLQRTTEKAYKVLSEDLGVPENELKNSYRDLSNNMDNLAARLLAGKMILKTQAEAVAEMGLKIDLGDAGPRQLAEFNLMIEEMAEMQGLLKNIQTQAARATSAGRIEVTSSLTRQQLEEWVDKAGGSKRIHDVAKQVTLAGDDFRKIRQITESRWDKRARRWFNIHNEGWINAILSGPVTHVVNMLSTAAHGVVRPLEKTIGGAATLNGKVAREGVDEIIGLAYNLTQTLGVYRMTLKAAKEGNTILDPGNTTYDAVQGAIANKHSTHDFNEAFFKQPLGALKGEVSFGQAALDFVGNGVRLPGRLLTAGDEFNKQLFYRSNLFAKGLAEARSRGLSSATERANYAIKYIDSRISEGGRATDMDSLYYSQESTFTNPLDYGLGKTLQGAANRHPYLRPILPFVRTPTNIVRQLWRHTPGLGFIQKQLREDLKSGDPRRKSLAIGQQVVGSTLFLTGFMAAASGKITGGGPSDSKRRALLRQTGWQPYSIVTTDENGKKVYTSYQRMDPWASALGLMADVHDVSRNADPGDASDLVQGTMVALAKNVTNKTYLRGVSEALGAIMDPERNMKHWWRQQIGSYVPNFANQFNPDDTLREVRSVLDAVKKRIPWFSETLDPKRNTFGEPILYGGALGEELGVGALSPFYRSKGLDSPIRQEMVDLNMPMSFRKSMVQPGLDLAQFRLSPNQSAHDRWQEMVGEIEVNGKGLEEVLNGMIKSEAYQRLPMVPMDDSGIKSPRASAIKKVINSYREAALVRLLRENPELKEMYHAAAINARRVKVLGAQAAQ